MLYFVSNCCVCQAKSCKLAMDQWTQPPVCLGGYLIFIAVKCNVEVVNSVACLKAAKHTGVVNGVIVPPPPSGQMAHLH